MPIKIEKTTKVILGIAINNPTSALEIAKLSFISFIKGGKEKKDTPTANSDNQQINPIQINRDE
ncbi:unnamed protein product [marine sediment metagenome]|uniref:Uncharacterized protein n=1 Tax=marine sediment metagenome TaxID=412755 RepID=X1SKA2_9ZZZZ